MTRVSTSFSQATTENANSRIYIGFHFCKTTVDGKALGDAIGNYVASTALAAAR